MSDPALGSSAFNYDASKEFPNQQEASAWAVSQRIAGSPKYLVRRLGDNKWEAIQEWLAVV